ncbi:hypothetical protein J1N35_010855 [Gossypium stocksii]|uniref:Uncharacterized protein n=1 Tax=Gossypium stocksii TaxID=47602 RepID=A0A9D3W2C2_9ROSI|nr:hypothetical protein J1N35_010855 [Gossypium stocksii]
MEGKPPLEVRRMVTSSWRQLYQELYFYFAKADRAGPSLTIFAPNVETKAVVESSTTQLCGRFIGLLQSSYYNVIETSMERYSSVSDTNFNFGDHYQLGYELNPNLDTRGGSTYSEGPSIYTCWQFGANVDRNMGYRRTDDLLSMIGSDKGTSNPLVEDENEDAAKEEDAVEEEGVANVIE